MITLVCLIHLQCKFRVVTGIAILCFSVCTNLSSIGLLHYFTLVAQLLTKLLALNPCLHKICFIFPPPTFPPPPSSQISGTRCLNVHVGVLFILSLCEFVHDKIFTVLQEPGLGRNTIKLDMSDVNIHTGDNSS